MGLYNPHAPQILGQEWVPIREETFTPDPFREAGYSFQTTAVRHIANGRFYADPDLLTAVGNDPFAVLVNVYPQGLELATGPIEKVQIPVMSGTVTGSATLSTTAQQDLQAPEDVLTITFGTTSGALRLRFNTTAYGNLLANKRILKVNVVGVAKCSAGDSISFSMDSNNLSAFNQELDDTILGTEWTSFTISAGEVSPFWSTGVVYPNELHPWRYSELVRFSSSGGSPPLFVEANWSPISATDSFASLGWLALEVFYCNETRVAAGARLYGLETALSVIPILAPGLNQIILRDNALLTPVPIAAGWYTVTMCAADWPREGSVTIA